MKTHTSKPTTVTWIDPDNNEILVTDTSNYVISQGTYLAGSKVSTLTIKTAKFASLSSGDVFKCKLKSAEYPDDSPDVVKEIFGDVSGTPTIKDSITF